jgi:hypothetical protein
VRGLCSPFKHLVTASFITSLHPPVECLSGELAVRTRPVSINVNAFRALIVSAVPFFCLLYLFSRGDAKRPAQASTTLTSTAAARIQVWDGSRSEPLRVASAPLLSCQNAEKTSLPFGPGPADSSQHRSSCTRVSSVTRTSPPLSLLTQKLSLAIKQFRITSMRL